MGRPFDRKSFDAFTPTGNGPNRAHEFGAVRVPPHVARYSGRPPYMTTRSQQERLRREGDNP